jgi:hypothetical protein
MVGAWDGQRAWLRFFDFKNSEEVRRTAKFVAAITSMYRWHWAGGAPGGTSAAASTHFEMSIAGFLWSWRSDRF